MWYNSLVRTILPFIAAAGFLVAPIAIGPTFGCGGGADCHSSEVQVYAADGCIIDVATTCAAAVYNDSFQKCGVSSNTAIPTFSLFGGDASACSVTFTCFDGSHETL